MSVEETRCVVEGYLGGHGTERLAERVEFFDPADPEPRRGRAQVAEWLRHFHEGAFADARAEAGSLVVGEHRAACGRSLELAFCDQRKSRSELTR